MRVILFEMKSDENGMIMMIEFVKGIWGWGLIVREVHSLVF